MAMLKEDECTNAVRGMVLALPTASDNENELMSWKIQYAQQNKRQRRSSDAELHVTTEYVIKGTKSY
ncbi:hypothetical protein BWQ96_09223 [Gracilariopsis chorda]|uniref:Uncharacterized protein n=1 Tax=Gracilariopsis chorda TaxID=448386 RepID=A0A2V3IGA2_9FLOR|nr:hypothetical protein BWQ96_09223 [Gracilariopsis chorda]|eukprot:PXF41058.1 hypothetical protein BWQ96_09223 [Gracilariopsis chorda]